MKIITGVIFTFFAIGILNSCNSSQSQNAESDKGELQTVNISELQYNEIVHEELSDKQIERISKFHEILKEVSTTPIEKTIENFQRDLNPDDEIAIWEQIAKAYQMVNSDNINLSIEDKNDVYNLLLYRSMMPKEQVLKKLALNSLSLDKAAEFISYYDR